MTLYTETEELGKLKTHAKAEQPNECIGLFTLSPYDEKGNWLLTDVITYKNVARKNKDEAAMISMAKVKAFNKKYRKFEPFGFRYGTYHSHPKFQKCQLSEKDEYIGKIYKQYRFQIIITDSKIGFWEWKDKAWIKGRIRKI